MAKTPITSVSDDGTGSFETYLEYNRTLRTWFVAWGVGGPALFLVNDAVAKKLVEAHELRSVVSLFLVGVAAQVFGALINKLANWYVYASKVDADSKKLPYRLANWVIDQFWIDVGLDLLTIGAFGEAAWLLMTVFATA
jgi:hypothetical protein